MSGVDQSLKDLKQHRDIIEMQTGGRFVEDEQVPAMVAVSVFCRRDACRHGSLSQMTNEFQALRFAAAQRVQRLTESQITETDFVQDIERFR